MWRILVLVCILLVSAATSVSPAIGQEATPDIPEPPDPVTLPPFAIEPFTPLDGIPGAPFPPSVTAGRFVHGVTELDLDVIRPYIYDAATGDWSVYFEHVGVFGGIEPIEMSADGRFVALFSEVVLHDLEGRVVGGEVYLLDRSNGDLTWISTREAASETAHTPRMSADGQLMIYQTEDGGIAGDANTDAEDAFIFDRATGSTQLLSRRHNAERTAGSYVQTGLSDNGSLAAYSVQDALVVVDIASGDELVLNVPGGAGLILFTEDSTPSEFTVVFSATAGLQADPPVACESLAGGCFSTFKYHHAGGLISGVGRLVPAIRSFDGSPVDDLVQVRAARSGTLLIEPTSAALVPGVEGTFAYVVNAAGEARVLARPNEMNTDHSSLLPLGFLGQNTILVAERTDGPEPWTFSSVRLAPFDDVLWSFHEGAIRWAADEGIVEGCGPARFCPATPVTRAQIATLLALAFDLDPAPHRFSDVSGVHSDAIGAIAAAGITVGCDAEGQKFCPDDPVTRSQSATLLARALELAPVGVVPFEDVDGVHAGSITALYENGITAGCTETSFCPAQAVRREQVATLLFRALNR